MKTHEVEYMIVKRARRSGKERHLLENITEETAKILKKLLDKLREAAATIDLAHEEVCKLTIERNELRKRLAQAERERDAAIHDLWGDCCYCAYNSLTDPRCIERCKRCKHAEDAEERGELGVDRWEWRGVCPGNSSDEEHQQA